ncbi:hypothetical protein B0H19DRAFT_1185026 [Mycena capillaripes]|nr:hypothetical protein B0H19DRAFT_1185026 [Mycena capillaripes]
MSTAKSLFDWPRSNTTAIVFPIFVLSSYISAIPLISFLAAPSGPGATFLTPLLSHALRRVSNDASTLETDPRKAIALLTVFYMFTLYVCSAVMSATAQLLGNKVGYKNREPRLNKRNLPAGLPNRMVATHEALYDIFPAYAITAALASSSSLPPSLSPSTAKVINALVLHVFIKLAIFSPAYLFDVDTVRSYSHMCAVAALLVGTWGVVVG